MGWQWEAWSRPPPSVLRGALSPGLATQALFGRGGVAFASVAWGIPLDPAPGEENRGGGIPHPKTL